MLFDNAAVLDSAGIHKFSSAKRLVREATRAWFTGLAFSILSGVYSLYNLQNRQSAISSSSVSSEPEKVVEVRKVDKEIVAVQIQLVSDLCDIVMPSTALGWANFDEGWVGLAGTTSSLLGVWSQWKKTA